MASTRLKQRIKESLHIPQYMKYKALLYIQHMEDSPEIASACRYKPEESRLIAAFIWEDRNGGFDLWEDVNRFLKEDIDAVI